MIVKLQSVCCLCSDLDMDFEIPFRELGFSGVPHRSTAFIMPTVRLSVQDASTPCHALGLPCSAYLGLHNLVPCRLWTMSVAQSENCFSWRCHKLTRAWMFH